LAKNAHGLTALGAAMTLMQASDKVRADVDGLRRQLDPMLVEEVIVKKWVDAIHDEIKARTGKPVKFQFGTMIEVVRACMRAETLAEQSEFFSFGTMDLIQAT